MASSPGAVTPEPATPLFGPAEAEAALWLVRRALEEDLPAGDITSDALFPAPPGSLEGRTGAVLQVLAKQPGVVCGLPLVSLVFAEVDPRVRVASRKDDGGRIEPGESFVEVRGAPASVLRGERVALNFLQRLSAIATRTARWVAELDGLRVALLDTRKTTPGWRLLEKYAVRAGGGRNHRASLSDGYLLKDNHARLLRLEGRTSIRGWVEALRRASPETFLEIEVEAREQFLEARDAGADALLLDNFSLEDLRWAVAMNRSLPGQAPLLEASGGVRLETLRAVAETGVDRISAGALTHSGGMLDMSLEVIGLEGELPEDS